MGDRTNPIKFGPEWLRNLALRTSARGPILSGRGRASGRVGGSRDEASGGAVAAGGAGGAGSASASEAATSSTPASASSSAAAAVAGPSSSTSPPNTNTQSTGAIPKVLLAKRRYGREEMLALYDSNSTPPSELRHNDTLYNTRSRSPVALNDTFEQDVSNSQRSSSASAGSGMSDRFAPVRSNARGMPSADRGRARIPFIRQGSGSGGSRGGGGQHWYQPRLAAFGSEEEAGGSNNLRGWSGEQPDGGWPHKTFRKRQTNSMHTTNWRSNPNRDEGEEWRSGDNPRTNRHNQDREWPPQDRSQGWSANRRPWLGGDAQNNEENLPEWAVGNASPCAGTFDSTGAFHGYSNDDSNIPKPHDSSSYSLTRSHTQGSFTRTKPLEEGSEEWWASEKAKKLSPKRFDATDLKFKKVATEPGPSGMTYVVSMSKQEELQNIPEKVVHNSPEPQDEDEGFKKGPFKSNFDSYDAKARAEMSEEVDRGNFQSVMINSNNGLRQKHQHLVPAAGDGTRQINPALMQMLQKSIPISQNDPAIKQQSIEDKLLDDLLDLTLEEEGPNEVPQPMKSPNKKPDVSNPSHKSSMQGLPAGIDPNIGHSPSSVQGIQAPGFQPHMQAPGFQFASLQSGNNQSSGISQSLQGPVSQPGFQGNNIHAPGHAIQSGMPQVGLSMGNNQIGNNSMGNKPIGNNQMGNNPMGNSNQMGNNPMSNNNQMSNNPMGNKQMGNNPMGNTPMGNNSMGNNLMNNIPIGSNPMGNNTIGSNPMSNSPMGPNPMGNKPMGNNSMGNNQMGNNPMGSNHLNLPIQGVSPNLPNQGLSPGLMSSGGSSMQGFQNSGLPSMPGNINNSLFMRQNSHGSQMPTSNDMSNNISGSSMFPLHGLQQHNPQMQYGSSIYSTMMQNQGQQTNSQNLSEQWYYEDPEKKIQGPFSSKDMYTWFKAGFFNPTLLVRRACDVMMRPLGSYGPIVPFAQMDMMSSFPMSGGFDSHNQGNLNQQPQMSGLDVINMSNMSKINLNNESAINPLQYSNLGLMRNQTFSQPPPQQPMVDNMWMQQPQSQASNDYMWMQHNSRTVENSVNNLSLYFWDQQPSTLTNSMLPEDITKEMKTEDQILAQIRASQNIPIPEPPIISEPKPRESNVTSAPLTNATPNLEELQKLLQKEPLPTHIANDVTDIQEAKGKGEKFAKPEVQTFQEDSNKQLDQSKPQSEAKTAKQAKNELEKAKTKEQIAKNGKKKTKEDKKEESPEIKDDSNKSEKKSKESSPSKSKKEDKQNKKDLEKEKKEWLKDGFTLVKTEKVLKDGKKKTEEIKAEEIERKKKEELLKQIALEEEKRRRQFDLLRKQEQQQRQAAESVVKKAPWSAANQGQQGMNKDGLTLAEIQRLEREKKLEQMREQQQMMQLIAQQQAAALAREQEMQAGLGWAKKKANANNQTLAEIQAEARKQSAVASAVAAAMHIEEILPITPPLLNTPWGSTHNGGGFWDTKPAPIKPMEKPQPQPQAQPEPPKPEPPKKKKPVVVMPVKKEVSPADEFEAWCNTVLTSWSSKIDVPTFVGFLKDIESPYEVKDYVKCYLGDTKESNDFARQFLERRSKLLRVGTVTPSDDLCSPAVAINPRTNSASDYTEVKGKGKKTKKNKMFKVDARILGFSVTASEDRINVGDIDTA